MISSLLITELIFSMDYNKALKDINNPKLIKSILNEDELSVLCSQKSNQSLGNTKLQISYLISNYNKLFDNHHELISESNIFNILANISCELLNENTSEPVCKFEKLIEWHKLTSDLGEDLFTTSFCAYKDILSGNICKNFCWPVYINHDNKYLNNLFTENSLSELHAHLKGSSLNFFISWISLMNNVSKRKKSFTELKKEELYVPVIKAAAIRYILFMRIKNVDVKDLAPLFSIVEDESSLSVVSKINELNRIIQSCKKIYGKNFFNSGVLDYAIGKQASEEIESFLIGERYILYNTLKDIYLGKISNTVYENLLYAYLLIKASLRKEFVQINEIIGFDNFSLFERRKELFIEEHSVYYLLLIKYAVNYFLKDTKNYLETRITPKKKKELLSSAIQKLDKIVSYKDCSVRQNSYYYILHFIKTKDKASEINSNLKYSLPRNNDLRSTVKVQAIAINKLIQSNNSSQNRICGIDAANSELNARPEVFAQAFRYLRKSVIKSNDGTTRSLGFTYHVGEDFLDVVDGLRAVDEVLLFLNFGTGDRIGHGLVLGIDVDKYYEDRRYELILPKQILVDNLAWLYYKIVDFNIEIDNSIPLELEYIFKDLSREVYGKEYTINSYINSWLLRGNSPDTSKSLDYVLCWYSFDKNTNEKVLTAEKDTNAKEIYTNYHFNKEVKLKGNETTKIIIPKQWIDLIKRIQRKMQEQLINKSIAIETNPTSNIKIGGFGTYCKHPIFKFYNTNLSVPYEENNLNISINTDDLGVFGTSLKREISLIAKAGSEIGNNSPTEINNWIKTIIEMSKSQRYVQL